MATVTDPIRLEQFLDSRKEWLQGTLSDLSEDPGGRPMLCLSFDDGYRDNLTTALPILERYQTPATIFVTTGFVDRVTEPLEHLLAKMIVGRTRVKVPNFSPLEKIGRLITRRPHVPVPPEGFLKLRDSENYESNWNLLQRPLKRGPLSTRVAYLRKVAKQNSFGWPSSDIDMFLNWDEVRELDRHPLITIGAHSHTHPRFDLASPWQAFYEAKLSKQRLEDELGHSVDLFSYPYGAQSYLARRMVRAAGFRYAYSSRSNSYQNSHTFDPLAIPRENFERS